MVNIMRHFKVILLAVFILVPTVNSAVAQVKMSAEDLAVLQREAGDVDWIALESQMIESFGETAQPQENVELEAEKLLFVEQYSTLKFEELKPNLFTNWESLEIKDARKAIGKVTVRTPKRQRATTNNRVSLQPPPPGERYIVLNGILYTSASEWVVWMNGKKISPNALPEEAIAFKVFPNYIEVKWFDDYTNQIIPLRLRPMQRFNIDQRIFLPG